MSGQTEIMWGEAIESDAEISDWIDCTLGDIINLKRGYDLPNASRIPGIVPIISSSGITDYHANSMIKGPGVVTGRYGTIGKVFYTEVDYWPLNTALYVQDFKGNDKKFIYYLLSALDFNQFSDKSAVPGINRNHVHEAAVSIPSLHEQRAIADVLSSLDDKIDLLHRQNATLETLAETLFRQWFVEQAKEEWELGQVKDLIDVLSGFPFKSSMFVESGQYSLITIKAVQNGYLELSNADKLDEIPAKMPEYCRLSMGDILLSLTGNVGRCCLVDSVDLLLNQRVAKMKPKSERDWAFTYVLFRQSSMRATLEELAKGTAQANLSPIETANMEFAIPDTKTLEAFSKAATPWIEKVMLNKKGISVLSNLRDTLLPKLMSGEVRVAY